MNFIALITVNSEFVFGVENHQRNWLYIESKINVNTRYCIFVINICAIDK